ncbi:MAG: hypothetical protein DHS20C17_08770 [Cyclobacteriaceae bacterium]|nr:MAG: hypothetical protein DHS20C17_08770 [Cyclobacteriaceae bacterium]
MSRSKGIIIKQERVFDYRITSNGNDAGFGSSEDEVKFNKRWQFKLRFPVIIKPGFKMAMGLEYFKEEYHFEGFPENDYPFYQSLEDKPLRSIGTSFYLVKPFIGNRYLLMRIGAKFNGDEGLGNLIDSDKLRISVAPLFGWKKNPYTSYAFGFAYSYDFGRQRVYPVFSYNHTFNNRLGLESIIPLEVKLRYSLSEKNIFYASTEFNGANYNIQLDDPGFPEGQDYYLRKSEIRFVLTYEREIHDWLWFSLESGLRSNITFELVDGPTRNANTVIDNTFNSAFLLNASIFIVPPRKLLD